MPGMAPPILTLRDIHLSFGDGPLLAGAELYLSAGDRLGLVGRNGTGKSTLLRIAAGSIEPDRGERFVQPGATIRYLPQEPDPTGHDSALDYVRAGLGPGDDAFRAQYLLTQLGLRGDEDPGRLSGGEMRRCALARALAPLPDILLLDEPTNHLDLPAIEWLEDELRRLGAALVLISHDRRLLQNLTAATIWLSGGACHRLDRGFADFEAWRDARLNQEERDRHKLERQIVREEDWLRYGVTARRKRNQRRLRALQDLREEKRRRRRTPDQVRLRADGGEASGKLVIEAKAIGKSYGGAPVIEDFSSRIQRGDRVGIVGPNGAGKTTLLNLLTGILVPDRGSVRLGANLRLAALDQRRDSLDPGWTLRQALTEGGGDRIEVAGRSQHVMGYLRDFLFSPAQADTPIEALSGGERGRLMLARALARPANLLVLDEPTNDLDLETLDLLQELLADYPGTVLLVSHDRDFLDRVVTSTIAAEGGGQWLEYPGGYSDMARQRVGAGETATNGTPARATTAAKPTPGTAPPSRRKLSFKEKHALETLPGRIDALQTEIAAHEAALADPALYLADRAAYEAATAGLTAAQADLQAAEEEWLNLELLREELERI
jgi:ATP-binding cassette subfamily F protein uup